jgi:hypothetical protein
MLKLNSQLAQAADNIASGIKESGKYVGTITRAEKLTAATGTVGLGLSIKTASGQTADYLNVYHSRANGEELPGLKTVNAILCCTKTQEAADGLITIERWNNDKKAKETVQVPGYPSLMGKKVGFLLQQVKDTNRDEKEVDRLDIFAVFNAETELTASEMYAKKTNPERLASMLASLMARPVKDNRKKSSGAPAMDDGGVGHASQDIPDDDIPF